jgi:hypothetical protein
VAQVTQNAVRGAIEAVREVGGEVDRPIDDLLRLAREPRGRLEAFPHID